MKQEVKEKQRILDILKEYLDYYELINDVRKYAYGKAIISLRNFTGSLDEYVTTDMKLPNIGTSIKNKIIYIYDNKIPASLTEIRLSMGQLKDNQSTNKHKHYTHREIVHDMICKLMNDFHTDEECSYELLGSYRRGNEYCGDADVLIICNSDISDEFIEYISDLEDRYGNKSYNLLSKGPSKLKLVNTETEFEIDVRFCKPDEVGTFKLHMTGSAMFNVYLRKIAKEMGYSLSEYGLLKTFNNKLLKFKNEEDVFKKLNLRYVSPEDRVFN